MKKVLVSLAVISSLVSAPAFAWGDREQGILSGIAGLWIYQQLSKPPVLVQQAPTIVAPPPVVYYQQPAPAYVPRTVYVYPTNVPIPAGMTCRLQSEHINDQIVTGNYCYYR